MKINYFTSVFKRFKNKIKENKYLYNIYKETYTYIKKKRHKVFILDYQNYDFPNGSNLYSLDKTEEISFPPIYWRKASYNQEKRILPEVNIFYIQNATVIGGSNILLINKSLGLYLHNSESEVNHSDSALLNANKEYLIDRESYIYESREFKRKNIESGISFCINYNFNYYHFVFECLSKFYILEKSNISKDIPIIIDSTARDIAQFQELIKIFNKDGREIVYVNRLQYVNIKNLFIITPIHYIPANYLDINNIMASSVTFNFECLKYLRDVILYKLESFQNKDIYSKRIFISRHNNKNREYNNDEIETFLKSKGFNVVYPEQNSLEEQVGLFYNADLIVAASGAALTNIIFCKPKTKIIVLANQKLNLAIFSNLAKCFGLNMIYLVGSHSDSKSLHSSFYIDIKDLSQIICKI